MIRWCPGSTSNGPYSGRTLPASGGSITKPPLKLSRVPSFSFPVWWQTEQFTPSAACLPYFESEKGRCAKTWPVLPCSFAS